VLGVIGLNEPLTSGIIVGFPLVLVGCIFATSQPKPSVDVAVALTGELTGDLDHAVDHQPE
jgi:hypothetical protein